MTFFYFFYGVLFLLTGVCIGSFMNVIIYRLPLMMTGSGEEGETFSLAWPPSHCPVCQNRIRFYDNIPVISWLLLRGKCRYCRTAISGLYPVTEAVTGLWFIIVYFFLAEPSVMVLTSGEMLRFLPPLVLFCLLYCITVTDFRHFLIPDVLSLGMLWAGLVFSVFHLIPVSPFQAVTGCVLTYCLILGIRKGYQAFRQHEGLGGGDVKLFAAAAAWLGLSQVPWLIVLSAVCGVLLYGVQRYCLKSSGEKSRQLVSDLEATGDTVPRGALYVPFGPAIVLATLILFFIRI